MCSWYRQFYLFVCFALFFHSWTSQSITISLVEQLSLLEWSLLMEEIQQTAMNHWFYWDLLYQGVHWSCSSSILATWKVCYFWTQFEFSPQKKKSKQHFRYPFLIPWKCFMAENHWKSALLNLHFCRKEKYLPISRRSSGSRSGSKLKPPQKVFSPKKKMVRIVWTVQSPRYLTFPSFYVSPFERSADRTWFQFLVWPGQCNTSQPGKRHKKPGEYFAAWKKNLVVDTLSQWNDTTWLLILIS